MTPTKPDESKAGLVCPLCFGTRKVLVTSFQNSSGQIEQSCKACKGSGYLPEDKDATIARQAARIRELEAQLNAVLLLVPGHKITLLPTEDPQ